MSLTNALDAIAVVGAIVLAGEAQEHLPPPFLEPSQSWQRTCNIVGGFIITDRM